MGIMSQSVGSHVLKGQGRNCYQGACESSRDAGEREGPSPANCRCEKSTEVRAYNCPKDNHQLNQVPAPDSASDTCMGYRDADHCQCRHCVSNPHKELANNNLGCLAGSNTKTLPDCDDETAEYKCAAMTEPFYHAAGWYIAYESKPAETTKK